MGPCAEAGIACPSQPREPVVAVVLPVAGGELVGDADLRHELRLLEAELGRDLHAHRRAELRRDRLVGVGEAEDGLRVQRRRQVDAGLVGDRVVAMESDVAGGEIRARALEERAQRHAAPLADHAPALDAHVPRHVGPLWQRLELVERPRRGAADEP